MRRQIDWAGIVLALTCMAVGAGMQLLIWAVK